MLYRLFKKELRYALGSVFLWLMSVYVVLETFAKGSEFFRNGRLNPIFVSLTEEWGYRTTSFPLYLYMLAGAVFLHSAFNRDERYGVRPVLFARKVSTPVIVLSRVLGIGVALCVAYTAGVFGGNIILSVIRGYYPAVTVLLYGLFFNVFPALIVWSVVVVCLSIWAGDLKVLAFPVVLAWFFGQVFNFFSLALTHTELGLSVNAGFLRDSVFLLHVVKMLGIGVLFYFLSVRLLNVRRIGLHSHGLRGKKKEFNEKSKEPGLMASAWKAQICYDFKVILGWKLLIGVIGSILLAFLIFGPLSPVSRSDLAGNTYFPIAFSELFLPVIGLLVSGGMLDLEERIKLWDVIAVMPEGKRNLLRQKLVGIISYFAAVLIVYVIALKVFVPQVSMVSAILILGASMVFVSVLAMCISWLSGQVLVGYGVAGILIVAALFLEDRFPWFLSPVYVLAESTKKAGIDRLMLNKILLLLYSITGLVPVLNRLYGSRKHRSEGERFDAGKT
jgi:hypothetical protein